MRILNQAGAQLEQVDLEIGYLVPEKILKAHHEAIPATAEVGHVEIVREYPNGGKDAVWVVDAPAIPAQQAWDEYEDVQRYIPYTAEKLAQRNQSAPQEDTDALLVDHEFRLTMLELGLEGGIENAV